MTTKRRGAIAGSPEGPTKGQKRRRTSTFVPETDETPEKTTEAGLELLAQIKQATDKHGQLVATEFLHLPNRKENPHYYQAIRLPIALDIVESKLRKHQYPCLTPVESDLRRMVSNAKYYNDKGSMIFSNAERIRKLVANRMPTINPAYNDPNYAPFATPIPEEDGDDEENHQSPEVGNVEDAGGEEEKKSTTETPALDQEDEANDNEIFNFEGETFESAQEKIIAGMMRLKDSDGEEVFFPFLSMPDRNLYKEYYEIIKHPVSLRAILKLVRGTDGRKNSTKATPFKTWDAFEEEVSYIWRNAREFNEDGSEIVALAGSLEEYFLRLLAEARKKIPDPPDTTNGDSTGPRIKLRMGTTKTPEPAPQKLTLRLSGKIAGHSTVMEHGQGGVSIDTEALRRQKEHVKASSNGLDMPDRPTPPRRNLRDRSGSGTRAASIRNTRSQDQEQQRHVAGASPSRPSSAVKTEGPGVSTPNLRSLSSQESMKPSRDSSGSAEPPKIMAPFTSAVPIQPNNVHEVLQPVSSSSHPYPSPAPTSFPMNIRAPHLGKGRLISNVRLFSHPNLDLRQSFLLDIPPSSAQLQQSITINLPAKSHILCVSPTIIPSSLQRTTQLTVTIGSQLLSPMLSPSRTMDPTEPYYEVRLGVGVTKIDIEMSSYATRGGSGLKSSPGQDAEYERLTVYANLMRA
ncbi:bromodomain-containing protein [Histoplasma ohiense]|nr:bromodomain-containing protein [Histoplasma ohiense (nom. inval.)]